MSRHARRATVLALAGLLAAAASAGDPRADYVVAFLHRGEARIPLGPGVLDSLQAGHMANIQRMAAGGTLIAAGPMGDAGNLRGLFFFRPDSLHVLEREMAPDAAIAAGRLRPTLVRWRGPSSLGRRYRELAARGDARADSMAQYSLVLLRRAGGFAGDLMGDAPRWRRHVADLAARGRAGGLRLSGPFVGAGEYLGLLVLDADSLAASRWIASEPFVRDGLAEAEIRPWWTAVAVLP